MAIPSTRHRAYVLFLGKFLKMGPIKEKQRTGAATLLIHILAKVLTNMLHSSTQCGLLPARDKIREARDLAMLCLERAAASEKPPSNNIITGPNISEKMRLAPFLASSGSPVFTSTMTLSKTTRTGIHMEVTNKGIAYRDNQS